MSYPPVFEIATDSSAVLALLGSPITRLWPFAIAPQPGAPAYALPYAVHQLVYGNPDNSLSCVPNEDLFGVQFDCYAKTATAAREVAGVLRDAYEGTFNHVTAWNGEDWEASVGLYRVSFTVEFWTPRASS